MKNQVVWIPVIFLILSGTLSAESVRTFQYDYQRTGSTSHIGADQPALIWSFSTDASIHASPVVDEDGNIFIASTDGRGYALNSEGNLLWTFQAEESLYATPTIGQNGDLYFADIDGQLSIVNSENGYLIDRIEIQGAGEKRILTSPSIDSSGRIYIGSWDNNYYVFDSAGSMISKTRLEGLPSASVALGDAGSAFFTAMNPDAFWPETFSLIVLKIDSELQKTDWIYNENLTDDLWLNDRWLRRNRITAAPTVDVSRNRVYVALSRAADGLLLGLDSDSGSVVLRLILPAGIVGSPALGPDGVILVPCMDGRLYAVDPEDENILWSFKTEGLYILGSPTVDGKGRIYVGDTDGKLYAISPGGKLFWKYQTRSNIASAPVVTAEGRILVTSYDGNLYVLGPPDVFYLPQIGNGIAGELELKTRIKFLNTGPDTEIAIELLDSEGSPQPLNFQNLGKGSQFNIPIARGEVFSDETDGLGDLTVGYVRVEGNANIGGLAEFVYSHQGVILSEAGIPATSGMKDFTLFVESGSNGETGFAFVNTANRDSEVFFRLYDLGFNHLATRSLTDLTGSPLGEYAHFARYAIELFPELLGQQLSQGILTVEADEPLAAITVRQNLRSGMNFPMYVPTLTTYPVMPSRADSTSNQDSESSVIYLPHLAQGLNSPLTFNTDLFLASTKSATPLKIEFFDQTGSPLSVPLAGRGPVSTIHTSLAAGQATSESTTGVGNLLVGSAFISAATNTHGTALFHASESGIRLFEAGVPESAPSTDFSLFVTISKTYNSGIALINTGNEPANVMFRLYDSHFKLLKTTTMEQVRGSLLPVKGHFSRFIKELFSAVDQLQNGLLTIESSQPLAAVTLCQADTPGSSYPHDIYRITVYPVVENRPDQNLESQ